MREKEANSPGARNQAATSQVDTRSSESKIYRRKERQKAPRQNTDEEKQVKF